MGKFMRKAKITRDVPPPTMDLSHSSLGVRTRAKTLALQKLHSQLNPNSSYLELRSRKLEKHQPSSARKDVSRQNPNPIRSLLNNSHSKEEEEEEEEEEVCLVANTSKEDETEYTSDFGGENNLEFVDTQRGERETTPIQESDTFGTSTPGSSTSRPRNILSTGRNCNPKIANPFDMDEFFKLAEQEEHRLFMEKYNFDVVNDVPLKGRYEWIRL